MASNNIICKLSYGDEMRRFTVKSDEISYNSISRRANEILSLGPAPYKLQYKDDEGDVITMSTDEEMTEAVALALSLTPPILRLTVKMDAPPPVEAATTTESAAPSASPFADPSNLGDLSATVNNITAQLPQMIEALGGASGATAGAAGESAAAILKNVREQLPKFVEQLPPHLRAQMPHAELDLGATLASNAAAAINKGLQPGGVSFSINGAGYGDQGVHPGVTCDKSGMSPIVGPRYNLKGHNYDLCEAEFNKLPAVEQANFVKIDPPQCPLPMPWRAKSWRHGMGGGCHGMGGGMAHRHEGAPKLAARFVSDVSIFDGTQVPPGMAFTKIWRMKNVGETAWPAGAKLLFVGGDRMTTEFAVPIDDGSKTVMPGEEVDVAVDMVAPTELGRYLGYWRLVGPLGRRRFGQRVWCHIQVVDPAGAEAPHDPSAVAAEISHLMARTSTPDDDKDDDDEAEDAACAPSPAAPLAEPAAAAAAAAAASSAALMTSAAVAAASSAAAAASNAAAAASSAASSVAGLSSAVSSATSSAVSVRAPEEAPIEVKEVEGAKVAAPAVAVPEAVVPKVAVPDVKPAAPEPKPEVAPVVKDEPVIVDEAAVASSSSAASDESLAVSSQLLAMGFEPKSVKLVLEKNGGVYPASALLEVATRDLVQLSEWDEMLSDLEEMGFEDRELNTRLIMKNNGSVKRTVKDLVADATPDSYPSLPDTN